MIPEERKRVLYVLIAARTDAKARGAMFNMYDEAIAIMRKEPEPQPCPNGEPCKHAGWCTEVYCQGIPVFRNQYKPEGWQPIETAPKDGTAIMLGARWGAWIGKYLPIYQSGYKPENPWSSLMLNHDHLSEKRYSPTHWMPLPPPPGKEPPQISDAEPYDQQALELCDKCGWKTLIPGDGCLNCARNLAISDAEIFDIAGNYDCGTNGENMEWAFQSPKELLDFARALLEKAK